MMKLCVLVLNLVGHFVVVSQTPDVKIVKLTDIMEDNFAIQLEKVRVAYSQDLLNELQYPRLDNLDVYLQSFVDSNCLITVDNFRQTNFRLSHIAPMIERNLMPFAEIDYFNMHAQLKLGPRDYIIPNNTKKIEECQFSKFFITMLHWTFCVYLDVKKFWRYAKPWNCKVQISVFPPSYFYDILQHLLDDETDGSGLIDCRSVFPSVDAGSIKIFIQECPSITPNNTHTSITDNDEGGSSWVIPSFCSRDVFCTNIFLLLTVTVSEIQNIEIWSSKGTISTMSLIRPCSHWTKERNPLQVPRRTIRHLDNPQNLLEEALPSPEFNLVWEIANSVSGGNAIDHMENVLFNCGQFGKESRIHHKSDPVSLIGLGYAHIWFSIMGNFTIRNIISQVKCSSVRHEYTKNVEISHITLEFAPYIRNMLIFPYFLKENIHSLRFVSCEERGFTSVAFQELVKVFDNQSWLLILASAISVVIPLQVFYRRKYALVPEWVAPVKVFLEQGDPFPNEATSKDNLKVVISTFLLMGVVLSNAYKNSNVYNMILPRNPVPYEYFRELLRDNFTIYTRVTELQVSRYRILYWFPLINPISTWLDADLQHSYAKHNFSIGSSQIFLLAVSEIVTVLMSYIDAFDSRKVLGKEYLEGDYKEAIRQSRVSASQAFGKTRLQPSVSDLMETALQNMMSYIQKDRFKEYAYMQNFEKEVRQTFLKLEEERLFIQLKRCNKVALVMPEFNCWKYARKLKVENGFAHAFVGKDESYSDIEWMFVLRGIIPPHLPMRIKSAHESGLWSRWTQLGKIIGTHGDYAVNGHHNVVAGNMKGNIVVIFVVWSCGLSLAFACFIIEGFTGSWRRPNFSAFQICAIFCLNKSEFP